MENASLPISKRRVKSPPDPLPGKTSALASALLPSRHLPTCHLDLDLVFLVQLFTFSDLLRCEKKMRADFM